MRNLFVALFALVIISTSCSSDRKMKKFMDEQDNKVLTQALNLGDMQTAIFAVQSLITRDTGNIRYLDTLVMLYQNNNNQVGVLQVSKRLLALNPNNMMAQENFATSAKQLQLFQEALNSYSQLYGLTNNTRYLYEVADIYYKVNNAAQGKQIFDQILNNPKSKTDVVPMLVGQNNVLQVPVAAASLNYLGFVEAQQNNLEAAKNLYIKALEIFPGFVIAKNNLANLDQASKNAKQPNTKQPFAKQNKGKK
jgi:tetratricopeptide (TPR) repeat protein